MRDILDPANVWLGTPGAAFVFGNKSPVALDDALTVLIDSGPVSVDVLANDSDPEGGALTLVSASASLGSAVAETNNTVTYTPPAGISGFDTVVYEIADDQDQRRTAQINVTITEPQLSIDTQVNNTLVVNAETGQIDITVTEPANFAGLYQVDTNDLASGPISLSGPAITGTMSAGQTLAAEPGLWIYDVAAGAPAQSWQWQRAGADIAGATAASYTVQASDLGPGVSVREIQTDSFGQRFADSAALGATFAPGDDPALIGWWDADDAATITENAGAVSSWANKAAGDALSQGLAIDQPSTGSRLLNGRNVLDFVGNHYVTAPVSLPASGDVAFHMVLIIDGTSNAFEAVLATEASNDFQIDANNAAQFDGRLNAAGVGTPVNLSGGPFSGALILSAVFDRTGAASADIFVSNTLRGSMAYSTALDPSSALHVMANRALNARVDGAVGELILTGDTSNRAQFHTYLSAKWGLV